MFGIQSTSKKISPGSERGLLLCPFCGNKDKDLLIVHKNRHKIQMECVACEAKGSARLTEEEAFKFWRDICEIVENKRYGDFDLVEKEEQAEPSTQEAREEQEKPTPIGLCNVWNDHFKHCEAKMIVSTSPSVYAYVAADSSMWKRAERITTSRAKLACIWSSQRAHRKPAVKWGRPAQWIR